MKLLINALPGSGDALMFSPALKVLKEKIPDSEIHMLVMFKSVGEMFSTSPRIDKIHHIDFLHQPKLASIKATRQLRKEKFDVAINIYPTNRAEYNLLNYFIGSKKRLAHSYIKTNLFRFGFLNTDVIPEIRNRHNVLQNLDLVKLLTDVKDEQAGKLEIFLTESDKAKANLWLESKGLRGKFIVGIHPGSSTIKNHIHKRWDKNKYIQLCKRLIEKYNSFVFIFGNEFELNEEIRSALGEDSLIVSTDDYMDSMLRLPLCSLFVSNDTAFMHSAAAFEIPTVGIFGYTNSKELYPWKTAHRIVREELDCSPCFYNSPAPASCIWEGDDKWKCMKNISVEKVFAACEELIQEIPHDSKSGNRI